MPNKDTQSTRIHYLDSWRGIAALSVVFFHLIGPFQKAYLSAPNKMAAVRILFDGTDWVSFFFVLSGFALSYGFIVSGKKLSMSDFYVKRFLRIYPLYLFALALCYLVRIQDEPYTFRPLIREAFLFSRYNYLLIPGWSLAIEICCSLLMPLIITLALTNRYQFWLAAFFSLLLYNVTGTSQIGFSGFLFHFFLGTGIALMMHQAKINSTNLPLHGISLLKALGILAICYIFFCMRWYSYHWKHSDYQIHRFCDFINMDYHQFFYFISGFASFVVILVTLGNVSLQKVLSTKPFLFMGEISFSIYLMHFPVIGFLFPKLLAWLESTNIKNHYAQAMIIVPIIIVAVFIVSYVTYISIEKPFINIAKKLVVSPKYISLREKIKYNL